MNTDYFRFQIFQGDVDANGNVKKVRSVGMAYLREGQSTYTVRLWTLMNERFYLIPSKTDQKRYLLLNREPRKNPGAKKYFWNIVGNGVADTVQGVVALKFDLFESPVFMNIHPESSNYASETTPDWIENPAVA